ncbi:MAG: hypothetical protein JWN04_4978 [Myxococcaceae bacterium]|nr:hypothetical protein [Myxococcaceae bacterium]
MAPALLTRLATASDEERTLRERVYQSLRQPDGTGRMPLLNEGVDPNAPEQAIGSHPTIPQDPAHLWPLCERYDLSGE